MINSQPEKHNKFIVDYHLECALYHAKKGRDFFTTYHLTEAKNFAAGLDISEDVKNIENILAGIKQ